MEKKIYTSIENNWNFINPDTTDDSSGVQHEGWTLYRLETEESIHYFFNKEKPPQKAVPCDKPEGYTVSVDKQSGIPYLVKKEKKKFKLF